MLLLSGRPLNSTSLAVGGGHRLITEGIFQSARAPVFSVPKWTLACATVWADLKKGSQGPLSSFRDGDVGVREVEDNK